MPQIEQIMDTYSSQIFWLLVTFGFVFFVVGRGMVPRVMDTIAQRDDQIAADLAAADAARRSADEEEEAWRKRENENRANAQAVIVTAKEQAANDNADKMAAVQERLDVRLAAAEADIVAARRAALTEIEAVASDAAQDIVRQLAGVQVTGADADIAVKKALAHA
ncbi:MAG: ATPase [Pontixanthobacter sp.]